ncbi:hypothetical protein [Streptomyces iranensis]|uniref:hypothetical protein n=1 Tax=Streptomyces iranensis TaxID=576784 RepID=UPI0039B78155
MHDDNNPDSRKRRWGLFHRAHRSAASWSERASNEASSALAPAPGEAGDPAGRHGAPELGLGVTEPSADAPRAPRAESAADTRPAAESPSWREIDSPVLPAMMNRKRTVEKRDQVKNIRFTPTAVRLINAAAKQRGQRFAGFVGDAALAAALGKPGLVGSPEDDPVRPLVEAIEAHIKALNRIGTNLNQITGAIHRDTLPEHSHAVLDAVDQAVQRSYGLMDEIMVESARHGA